ncbi:MAG: hypothetical protein H0X30_08685 [Anaerolineae bacterium]|nr:hypothetical protein [Anaerolineae bacterium]
MSINRIALNGTNAATAAIKSALGLAGDWRLTTKDHPLQITDIHSGGTPQKCSGGISRANRRSCVISVAAAGQAADTKCQFGGCLPHIRPPFRRNICTICNFRRI